MIYNLQKNVSTISYNLTISTLYIQKMPNNKTFAIRGKTGAKGFKKTFFSVSIPFPIAIKIFDSSFIDSFDSGLFYYIQMHIHTFPG